VSDKNNKTLKPDWRRVKFGDVVRLSKARSQDPLADGIERYVGLEHLEPGDLNIRSWGSVADGVTFTSVFQPGQVLFGKRRAYQRKVALADFSGVCSGDIYVLETKDAKDLLPELLPFICQTDAFFDHAVGTSAGSLSPRTNWTSLADFQFFLPPIEEQIELIDLLRSASSVLELEKSAVIAAWDVLRSILVETFDTGADPLRSPIHKKWECVPLSRFISVKHGWAFKGDFFSEDSSNGPQLLIPGNFTEFGWFDFSPEKNKYYTGNFPDEYRLARGDLLLLMTDLTPSAKLLGAPGIFETNATLLHNQRLGKVVLNQFIGDSLELFKEYLHFFFLSEVFRRQVRAQSAGSTVSHSSPTQICRIAIPCPGSNEIESVVATLRAVRDALLALKQRANDAAELMAFLRRKMLEGQS
jgi:type I restriction enzyme S subunit